MSEELMDAQGNINEDALTRMENEVSTTEIEGYFGEMLGRVPGKIRADRAKNISEDAEMYYRREIEDLKTTLTKKLRQRENYLDMSPESVLSLKIAEEFNGKEFAATDIKLSVAIRNLSIELEVAKKRYARLFGKEID